MTFKFYTSLWLIKSSIFNAKPQVIKVVAHFKKYSYKKLLRMSKKRLEGVMLRCLNVNYSLYFLLDMIKLNFFSYRLPLTTSGSLSMSLFFFSLEMIYKKKISSCVKGKYTSWKRDTYQGILEKKLFMKEIS